VGQDIPKQGLPSVVRGDIVFMQKSVLLIEVIVRKQKQIFTEQPSTVVVKHPPSIQGTKGKSGVLEGQLANELLFAKQIHSPASITDARAFIKKR
jgi:hypothetical protein